MFHLTLFQKSASDINQSAIRDLLSKSHLYSKVSINLQIFLFLLNSVTHRHCRTKIAINQMSSERLPAVVGDDNIHKRYHTETVPCTRTITPEEAEGYITTPMTIVGKKFMPKDGEEIWEVLEVSFGKKGWSSVVQFEGHEERHNMEFEDFMRMLKQGVLNVVELE